MDWNLATVKFGTSKDNVGVPGSRSQHLSNRVVEQKSIGRSISVQMATHGFKINHCEIWFKRLPQKTTWVYLDPAPSIYLTGWLSRSQSGDQFLFNCNGHTWIETQLLWNLVWSITPKDNMGIPGSSTQQRFPCFENTQISAEEPGHSSRVSSFYPTGGWTVVDH